MVREREVETLIKWSGLVDQHKVDWFTVMLSYLISLNPLLFKNIAYVGSFQQFVFVFVFEWTKDMSQRALQPIYINTGTLDSCVFFFVFVFVCVFVIVVPG